MNINVLKEQSQLVNGEADAKDPKDDGNNKVDRELSQILQNKANEDEDEEISEAVKNKILPAAVNEDDEEVPVGDVFM